MFAMLVSAAFALTTGSAQAATIGQAHPDTTGDYISLAGVGSPNSNLGDLFVSLSSSSAVTTVTVHIYDSAGTTDLLDPAVTETSGNGTDGGLSTWTVTTPITTGQLPAGQYLVVVGAADTGGTTITGLNGMWYFTAAPAITSFSADHTGISFDSPSATISGQVVMDQPDGTVTPYQGPILLQESWANNTPTAQTDSNGNFTVTVTPTGLYGNSPTLWVQAGNTSTGRYVNSATVTFALTIDPTAITAKLGSGTVTYGTQATVSGAVTYQPGAAGAYQPLTTPTEVAVYSQQNPYTPAATGKTNASGDYSITLPNSAATDWTVEVGAVQAGSLSLLGGSSASLPMTVIYPTTITGTSASLSQYWQVKYSGCLGLSASVSGVSIANANSLKLQWAHSPAGPWMTLSSARSFGGTCGQDGIRFTLTGTAAWSTAYYRAYYPAQPATGGSPTTGGTGFHAATSNTLLEWKYDDRITGLTVSPTTVSRNGHITVKGALQYLNSSGWHYYGGQTILILLQPKGSSTWYWVVKVKTSSAGRFSATIADAYVSGYWGAAYDGNATHLAAGSPNSVYVRIS